GLAPGQNTAARIRAVRRRESAAAWPGQAGGFRLLGLHSPLWADVPDPEVSRAAVICDEAVACHASGGEADAAAGAASADPRARRVAANGVAGMAELSCRSGQHCRSGNLSAGVGPVVAARVAASRPAPAAFVGALRTARRSLGSPAQDPAPSSQRTL